MPTYRRAHLLEQTISSYLQPEVSSLILVDDCSPDDTPAIAKRLVANDSRVIYLRNSVNSKQTFSKNRALELVKTEFVYFGDDDSILSNGGIARLKRTMISTKADIVGAAALYMLDGEDLDSVETRRQITNHIEDIIYLPKLFFDFSKKSDPQIVEAPLCQASFMAYTSALKDVRFDLGYIGNCYREETDFLLKCRARGCRIVLDTGVTQINLPPSQATGGARGRGRLHYEWFALYNTVRFLGKNRNILKQVDARCSCSFMLCSYALAKLRGLIQRVRVGFG